MKVEQRHQDLAKAALTVDLTTQWTVARYIAEAEERGYRAGYEAGKEEAVGAHSQ